MSIVLTDISPRGVATVTLNRPEVGNAYNVNMLAALIDGWRTIRPRRISPHPSPPRGPCNG